DIQNSVQVISNENTKSMQERSKLIREAYEEHQRLGLNSTGFAEWDRWFNPLNSNNRTERTAYYLAFLLLNILFLTTLSVGLWFGRTGAYAKVLFGEAI